MKELLNEEIIFQEGPLVRKRQWYRGHSHWQGKNIEGWTGPENVIETTQLFPNRIFEVI